MILLLATAVVTLSYMDYVNTTYILSKGGEELNPFMNMFIDDDVIFFLVKMGLTLIGVIILAHLKQFYILLSISIIYFLLICYQLYLIIIIN